MIGCMAFLFREGTVHHVADVVAMAVGINLLFPVASSFLKCFLDGIEIEPEKIVEKYFENQSVTPEELQEVAIAAKAISDERSKCSPLAWGWWLADAIAACIGILLLLSGWEDYVGLWCLLLFLPVFLAIGWAITKYKKLRETFLTVIDKVKKQVATRKKGESSFVKNYVKKCNAAIKRNSNGRKKTSPPSHVS